MFGSAHISIHAAAVARRRPWPDGIDPEGLRFLLDGSDLSSTGALWKDRSGEDNDAEQDIVLSRPTIGTHGMEFGGDDWMSLPNIALGTDDFTIMAWARLDGADNYQAIFSLGQTAAGELLFYWSDDKLRCYADGGALSLVEPAAQAKEVWRHCAIVCYEDAAYLYVDGVERASGSCASLDIDTAKVGVLGASEEGAARFLEGGIGYARLAQRAYTETEIQRHHNATRGRFGV